jgi:tetratricopeptide (TPR) repeat protein
VFIVFAGAALVEMYNLWRAKKFTPIFISAGVVILFVLVEFFASPKFNYSDYDAYINLGNTAFENKEYDKALTYYRKSLQSESSYLTYVLIGNTLAVRGDINAAEYSYQKAIELNNKYELSYFNLGLLYSQTNQIEKAINQFNKVIEINPKFSDAYRNLAIALYIKEEYQAALEYFEKYLPMVKGEELKKSVIQDIENIKKLLKKNDG